MMGMDVNNFRIYFTVIAIMEWGIYSYFGKMVDEIEITLFLVPTGLLNFFG
jgi:hypothetical protein